MRYGHIPNAVLFLFLAGCASPYLELDRQPPGALTTIEGQEAGAVTMVEARRFAYHLWILYDRSIVGQAKQQESARSGLLAMASGAIGSVLFKAHQDAVSGFGLAGGIIYAANSGAPYSARREILYKGAEAMQCLIEGADRSGLTRSSFEELAISKKKAAKLYVEMRTAADKLKMVGREKTIPVTAPNDVAKAVDGRITASRAIFAPYQPPLDNLELAANLFVLKAYAIHTKLNNELSRLEPDIVQYAKSLRDGIGQGFGAVSGIQLQVSSDATSALSAQAGERSESALDTVIEALASRDADPKETKVAKLQAKALAGQIKQAMEELVNLERALSDYSVKSITVPKDLFSNCSLMVGEQAMRVETADDSLKPADNGKTYTTELRVIGGRGPHFAHSHNPAVAKVQRVEPITQSVSIVTLGITDRGGKANIVVVDAQGKSETVSLNIGATSEDSANAACTTEAGISENDSLPIKAVQQAQRVVQDWADGNVTKETRLKICTYQKERQEADVNVGRLDGYVDQKTYDIMKRDPAWATAVNSAYHPFEWSRDVSNRWGEFVDKLSTAIGDASLKDEKTEFTQKVRVAISKYRMNSPPAADKVAMPAERADKDRDNQCFNKNSSPRVPCNEQLTQAILFQLLKP